MGENSNNNKTESEEQTKKLYDVCIWECTSWLIWKTRNAILFRKEQIVMSKLVEELKARSWSWISTRNAKMLEYLFADWSSNPRRVFRC